MRARPPASNSGWQTWTAARIWKPLPGSTPATCGSANWRCAAARSGCPGSSASAKRFPRVAGASEHGVDAAYRLALDNPGQIGGLQMKTYEPEPLGPHDVEIEVSAAGAQLPRRNGYARAAAIELVRALGARPYGRVGGERYRAPRRRRGAHLQRRRRGGVHPGRLHRQPRRCQGLPGVPQARCAEHGAGRRRAVGVRHRLLFADPPGAVARGPAGADSLRDGRRRPGSDRPGAARRCADLRHRRQREQA